MHKVSNKIISFITEAMKTWKGELTTGRKIWGGNAEWYLLGRYAFTIAICNSDYVTQSHTQKRHRGAKKLINRK